MFLGGGQRDKVEKSEGVEEERENDFELTSLINRQPIA